MGRPSFCRSRPSEVCDVSLPDRSAQIDEVLLAFENAAASTRVPDVEPFLPPPGDPGRAEAIRELARVALELRWMRGERPDAAEYLARFPELADRVAAAEVVFEDYRQRILAGDAPSRESYRRRFGVDVTDWPGPVASTANADPTAFDTPAPVGDTPTLPLRPDIAVTEIDPVARPFPKSGDIFAGFRLIRELGRGAFGRVFLAEQIDLADRRVALKISSKHAGEVRTLARLQHTNIVPIFSSHRALPFTAVCMPFFGATTLASVLADAIPQPRSTSGRIFVQAIRRRQIDDPIAPRAQSATMTFLESASHVDAVLWIGERIADALAHAHERGIRHRDIKPANVLIGDDGQPMLLDFNLADDTKESLSERARVGGTLAYMAPEQVRAFEGAHETLDDRVDVYSLGVLLFQLLTCRLPYPDHFGETEVVLTKMHADRKGGIPRLRPHNPDVTPAVESIVRTCLQPDPSRRYPSAAALRDDIARHRADLLLNFAPEPSLRERARKWIRRHPQLVSPAGVGVYTAAVLLITSAILVRTSLDARVQRQDSERAAAYRQYEEFLTQADQVKLAAGAPNGSPDVFQIGSNALHRYGVAEPDWEDRPAVTSLPTTERSRLKSEVGELAFLTARAAAVLRRDADLAERWNTLAANTLGPDERPVAAVQRSELLGIAPSRVAVAVGNGGRSDFLRACDLSVRGLQREALPLVARFVARHPDDFGGWYLKARCHDMLGQFEDARAAYSTCAALRPLSPRPVAARGDLEFRQGKDLDQARADLDRALQLDPRLEDARLTHALVLRALHKYREALADLDELIASNHCPTRVYFVRAGAGSGRRSNRRRCGPGGGNET